MLDPQMQAFIDQLGTLGMPPDFAAIGAAAAKASAAASGAMMGTGPAMRLVEELSLAGPAGPLAARLYQPEAAPAGLIVYYHGGGWVLNDLDGFDAAVRRLADRARCALLAVDYRLAPEHIFPAAFDDAYAALIEADARRGRLDLGSPEGRPRLPLIVAGDSAGATLAAAVAIAARDRGGPDIAIQLLLYPATDADFATPSYRSDAEGGLLTAAAMRWFWEQYVPDPTFRRDPRAAPQQAASLAGLPPAIIEIAGLDPLRDEGEAYAARLRQEGVTVRSRCWTGLSHGFFQLAQILFVAGDATDAIADRLRETLATVPADAGAAA